MITYIINSGFGHAVRFLAVFNSLKKRTLESVICLAPKNLHNFIKENINCNEFLIYNLNFIQRIANSKNVMSNSILSLNDKKILTKIKNSRIVIFDFLNIENLKCLFNKNTIYIGIYHSSINFNANDSITTTLFKKTVINLANKGDYFFHIDFHSKNTHALVKCKYINTPLITRNITMSKEDVFNNLGLSQNDSYLLVHLGACDMENLYKEAYNLLCCVNTLNVSFKIVVAAQLTNAIKYNFNKNIILAPLYLNGINLVNAAEIVISKPGMGILQDCIKTLKPLIFIPPDTPERQLKIELLNQVLDNKINILSEISKKDLEKSITDCLNAKSLFVEKFKNIPTDGDEFISEFILNL